MTIAATPRLITADEFAALDEIIGFRDELMDGERVLSPNAVFPHAAVIKRLESILESQLANVSPEPLQVARETGWKFHNPATGADSVPAPDLMVIRKEDAQRAIRNSSWFEGVPLFVIEVISPSERKTRRLQKIGLYLDMGVPNVIEVDYSRRVVRVHTTEADSPKVYGPGEKLSEPFRASVDEIFSVLD
jgi:Uma2 family endonuclease